MVSYDNIRTIILIHLRCNTITAVSEITFKFTLYIYIKSYQFRGKSIFEHLNYIVLDKCLHQVALSFMEKLIYRHD